MESDTRAKHFPAHANQQIHTIQLEYSQFPWYRNWPWVLLKKLFAFRMQMRIQDNLIKNINDFFF